MTGSSQILFCPTKTAVDKRKDKMFYSVPLGDWMKRACVRDFVEDALLGERSLNRGIFTYGSGIHRILNACRDSGLQEPLLENFSEGFRIKFTLPPQGASHNFGDEIAHVPLNVPLNESVFDLIKHTPGINRKELAVSLAVADKTISRYISKLRSTGKIEYRGSKKTGGYWTAKEQ